MLTSQINQVIVIAHWSVSGELATANVNYSDTTAPPNIAEVATIKHTIPMYNYLVEHFTKEKELILDVYSKSGIYLLVICVVIIIVKGYSIHGRKRVCTLSLFPLIVLHIQFFVCSGNGMIGALSLGCNVTWIPSSSIGEEEKARISQMIEKLAKKADSEPEEEEEDNS